MQALRLRHSAILIALSVFTVLACLGQSWAVTLNAPRGLALDTKGNLYVANQNGNQVLMYNTSYALKKTITAGVSEPADVAFDSQGNLYVANRGNNSVTQYSSKGVQNANFLLNNGINNPWGIAIDALENLYVSNNFTDITMYALPLGANNPPPFETIYPNVAVITALAAQGPYLYFGGENLFGQIYIDYLAQGQPLGLGFPANEVTATTVDKNGMEYFCNIDGTVVVFSGGTQSTLFKVNFTPEGIAVDATRGRFYVSNENGNQIGVYDLSGNLLHTIQ